MNDGLGEDSPDEDGSGPIKASGRGECVAGQEGAGSRRLSDASKPLDASAAGTIQEEDDDDGLGEDSSDDK